MKKLSQLKPENNKTTMEYLSQATNRVQELCIYPHDYAKHKANIAKLAGPDYQFTDDLRFLWNKLFLYFIGSPESELDLNKSIALTGHYGVGKSTIFQIIHRWLEMVMFQNPNTFRISSTEDVINLFDKKEWLDSVLVYNMQDNVMGVPVAKPIHILVNEFAYQYDVKHYGTHVKEYIEMFIMKRYDIFQQNKKLTHITMNFDIKELPNHFSPRIVDRFREMFNTIELKGSSFRK